MGGRRDGRLGRGRVPGRLSGHRRAAAKSDRSGHQGRHDAAPAVVALVWRHRPGAVRRRRDELRARAAVHRHLDRAVRPDAGRPDGEQSPGAVRRRYPRRGREQGRAADRERRGQTPAHPALRLLDGAGAGHREDADLRASARSSARSRSWRVRRSRWQWWTAHRTGWLAHSFSPAPWCCCSRSWRRTSRALECPRRCGGWRRSPPASMPAIWARGWRSRPHEAARFASWPRRSTGCSTVSPRPSPASARSSPTHRTSCARRSRSSAVSWRC